MSLISNHLIMKLYLPKRGFEMTVSATIPLGENSD